MEEVDEFADHASFLMGFNHPLGGMDHLAAALLTGVAAARLGKGNGRALPAGALAGLAAGYAAGAGGLALPGSESMILASVILGGLMLFAKSKSLLKSGSAALIVFQLWHGNVHALEAPQGAAGGYYSAGAGLATVLVMILGFSLALTISRRMPGVLTEARAA